jgi:hypothetical protein
MENTIEENIFSPKVGRLTSQKRTWSSVVLLAGVRRIALMMITIKNFIVTKRSNEQKLILNLI